MTAAARQTQSGAERRYDIIIIGGGMVGAVLAVALGRTGMSVAMVDRADPDELTDAGYDGRSSAIAFGTRRILEAAGVWPALAPVACPILDIRVTDGRIGEPASRLFLHYDHRLLADADGAAEPLGHIVENTDTRRALAGLFPTIGPLDRFAPAAVARIDRGPGLVRVALADGQVLAAPLLVGADGRSSLVRTVAGIGVVDRPYRQVGLVCTVSHPKDHGCVAHEHFLPSGPFAVLPMLDDARGTHRSSIVWTERPEIAERMMALDDQGFSDEMTIRFGETLGPLCLASRRWSYPLGLLEADRYADHRVALVGDAAHGIHPIAGQGLNLGLRDVAALAEILVDARRLGQDIGDRALLDRYQRWRRPDVIGLATVTDGLNRLFSNDWAPIRQVRDLGLAVVDQIDPLKRVLMRHAMGTLEAPVGGLPRMARGKAL